MKRWVGAAFDRAGYTLVPNWRLQTYPQAAYLRRLFEYLQIDCVLDVGANLGQFRDFLRHHVEYQGLIVSFEPIPEHAEALRTRAFEDGRWRIWECALGRSEGAATFHVMKASQFSSLHAPDHSHTDRFSDMNVVSRPIQVQVRTLETVLPQLHADLQFSATYLKLDTQGHDVEVVEGAGSSLSAIRALQTEASVTPLYAGAPRFDAAIAALEAHGFVVSGVFPNNAEHHFPELVEFDCHMVARRMLVAPAGKAQPSHLSPVGARPLQP